MKFRFPLLGIDGDVIGFVGHDAFTYCVMDIGIPDVHSAALQDIDALLPARTDFAIFDSNIRSTAFNFDAVARGIGDMQAADNHILVATNHNRTRGNQCLRLCARFTCSSECDHIWRGSIAIYS